MKHANLADKKTVQKTVTSLRSKGYVVSLLENGKEVLEKIKDVIPEGSSVMNGSSETLKQIGFLKFLKDGEHSWQNLHEKVTSEDDPKKRTILRRKASISDYYLGSVHALTEDGIFIVASNSGSQLPGLVYNAKNLILVISTKKITKDLENAIKRLEEHVVPLEDKQMMEKNSVHTAINKLLIFKGEAKTSSRSIYFLLVKEDLGF